MKSLPSSLLPFVFFGFAWQGRALISGVRVDKIMRRPAGTGSKVFADDIRNALRILCPNHRAEAIWYLRYSIQSYRRQNPNRPNV
jgi:hypothetical protein